MNDLEGVVKAIEEQTKSMTVDMAKLTNKAAARRARKTSINLGKLYKQYRKLSVK